MRAKRPADQAYAWPTLCYAIPCFFLAVLPVYDPVAFHLGPCEKPLRDVKLATSSLRYLSALGRYTTQCVQSYKNLMEENLLPPCVLCHVSRCNTFALLDAQARTIFARHGWYACLVGKLHMFYSPFAIEKVLTLNLHEVF